jgi:hypothetical protein
MAHADPHGTGATAALVVFSHEPDVVDATIALAGAFSADSERAHGRIRRGMPPGGQGTEQGRGAVPRTAVPSNRTFVVSTLRIRLRRRRATGSAPSSRAAMSRMRSAANDHARELPGVVQVDALDRRVGVRAAHDRHGQRGRTAARRRRTAPRPRRGADPPGGARARRSCGRAVLRKPVVPRRRQPAAASARASQSGMPISRNRLDDVWRWRSASSR